MTLDLFPRVTPRGFGWRLLGVGACNLLLLGMLAQGTVQGKPAAVRISKDPAAASLDDYLRQVHAESDSMQPVPGALWTEGGRFTRLSASHAAA